MSVARTQSYMQSPADATWKAVTDRMNLRARPVALPTLLVGALVLLSMSWLNQQPSIKPAGFSMGHAGRHS